MLRALDTAATGMAAEQMHIDVISNNLANVNTTGFRRSRAEFQDLVYQTLKPTGAATGNGTAVPSGMQIGQGTRAVATARDFAQGTLRQTGHPLDVAIEGGGFLRITRPNGEPAYTRAGNLRTDAEGKLVTVDGYPVDPEIGIPPDATSVTIAPDGTVSVTQGGSSEATEVGRIQLATFPNVGGLDAIGRNLLVPTVASGDAVTANPGEGGTGTLAQGFLEGSNVEVVTEMIDLITSQRAYEINHRVIQAADEMLRRTTEGR
jgi:flagellar basal-body rod protein FlgG